MIFILKNQKFWDLKFFDAIYKIVYKFYKIVYNLTKLRIFIMIKEKEGELKW